MKYIAAMISLIFFVGTANSQTIDKESSIVNFSIGNMKWKTVEGTFAGMKGDIVFDKDSLSSSSFNVSIDPASVNTESKRRDDHLKNEDFFHVEKYATINFKSDQIEKEGDKYITKGKLTLHGVSKNISVPFTVKEKGNKSIFEGEIDINRFDYGLGAKKYKGTFMVGDTVNVKVVCVVLN